MPSRVIASDLDGTLIPPELDEARRRDIARFGRAAAGRALRLAYVTGRHAPLALAGIREAGLPPPAWLFADVGTSLHVPDGPAYAEDPEFHRAMIDALGLASFDEIRRRLAGLAGLELQDAAKQAEFKLSYDVRGRDPADVVPAARARVGALAGRLTFVASRDPITGHGLLDVLPADSGKRFALEWLRRAAGLDAPDVLFAGDSGNDRDALLSGHPAVLVGNAPGPLREALRREARETGVEDRVYFARASFAAGVLEGCRHFGFL